MSGYSTLKELALRIRDDVYGSFHDYKVTIFLAGAGPKSADSIRRQIDSALRKTFWYQYDIFYPEDIFDDLRSGPGRLDLMSMEHILANSVNAIVIIIESPGAIAELGTFSNNPVLRKKLVCIVNKKYERKKSYINLGPLRLINDTKEGRIVYGDFSNIPSMVPKINKAILQVHKSGNGATDINSVVHAHHFILSAIYLMQPVKRETLKELVQHASDADEQTVSALASGALAILNSSREIELTPAGYQLASAGMDRFENLGRRGWTRQTFDLQKMDQIRVAILNWHLRGKPLRI
ncbi:retron St85 family effector protein [Candidatus Neomarinimicrobiota bacterium]